MLWLVKSKHKAIQITWKVSNFHFQYTELVLLTSEQIFDCGFIKKEAQPFQHTIKAVIIFRFFYHNREATTRQKNNIKIQWHWTCYCYVTYVRNRTSGIKWKDCVLKWIVADKSNYKTKEKFWVGAFYITYICNTHKSVKYQRHTKRSVSLTCGSIDRNHRMMACADISLSE